MTITQQKQHILKGYNNLPTEQLKMLVKNKSIMVEQLTQHPDYDNEIGSVDLEWYQEQIDYINTLLQK